MWTSKDGKLIQINLMNRTSLKSQTYKRFASKGSLCSYQTGTFGTLTGVMLGTELIEKRGVYEPELCVPAKLYIQEQAKWAWKFRVPAKSFYKKRNPGAFDFAITIARIQM
jgi:hypothetical protein